MEEYEGKAKESVRTYMMMIVIRRRKKRTRNMGKNGAG